MRLDRGRKGHSSQRAQPDLRSGKKNIMNIKIFRVAGAYSVRQKSGERTRAGVQALLC